MFGGQRAAFLSSVGGLGSLTGRLLYGPVLRSDHVTPVGMFGLLGAINVGAFALDPVLSAWYPATAALAFANGLALGTSVGLFIPMARQVLDEEWHIQGWAAPSGSFSVGELVGGALAGIRLTLVLVSIGPFTNPCIRLGLRLPLRLTKPANTGCGSSPNL